MNKNVSKIVFVWAVTSAVFFAAWPVRAGVPIDYPGWVLLGGENKLLPGIPGGVKANYARELVDWAERTSPRIPLPTAMASPYFRL